MEHRTLKLRQIQCFLKMDFSKMSHSFMTKCIVVEYLHLKKKPTIYCIIHKYMAFYSFFSTENIRTLNMV